MSETQTGPKYPNVHVPLVGTDGNAFSIMGLVAAGLKKAGVRKSEIDQYTAESMSGDYNHLLQTAARWVDIVGDEDDVPGRIYLDDDEDDDEDGPYVSDGEGGWL